MSQVRFPWAPLFLAIAAGACTAPATDPGGLAANTNEMCILAGVAYPAKAGFDLGTSLESVL
jgi:hypothetical protein